MRIDAYSAIGATYAPTKAQAYNKQAAVSSYGQDQLQISSIGKDFQTAKASVAKAPDVREDLVAAMKEKYENDPQVDMGDFADVLLSRFNATI